MNLATQRPGDNIAVYSFWYACQADCWGMQHGGSDVEQLFDAKDGMVYQYITYFGDDSYPVGCPVLHGPAPKSWVDTSDFGRVIPDFC